MPLDYIQYFWKVPFKGCADPETATFKHLLRSFCGEVICLPHQHENGSACCLCKMEPLLNVAYGSRRGTAVDDSLSQTIERVQSIHCEPPSGQWPALKFWCTNGMQIREAVFHCLAS